MNRVELFWEKFAEDEAMNRSAARQERVAYLRDQQRVTLVARLPRFAEGDWIDFFVFAQNARGNVTPWRRIDIIRDVRLDRNREARAVWNLRTWEMLNRWAFACFRFSIAHARTRASRARRLRGVHLALLRSPSLQHYARTVGIYGFGPVGEIFSNAEIRRIARVAGGVAIRRRARRAMRRLATQVPLGENLRIFGYSLGACAALKLAAELRSRGVAVELLALIDPVSLRGAELMVPDNVRRAVSWFQKNGGRWFFLIGRAGRGVPISASDATRTTVENCELSHLPSGLPAMHEDVPFLVANQLISELRDEKTDCAASTVPTVEA